eukprot:TRINITY_DN1005_c0_g3_i1.p1 TRINITY_DN1005_c0_g3~~TRINITY_DN1005_c0_g3_i1.p1  ORF type:complete len:452 (-),score=139.63 TRINITY_DN1005_c0_g3_i1:412-1767(-)
MGCVIGICAATACACCVNVGCQCCGMAFRLTTSVATRATYAVVFLLLSIVQWVLSAWASDIIGWIPYVGDDCDTNPSTCGSVAVYKIAFPLSLFHLLLALLLIGVNSSSDPRAKIQTAWWPLKLPLLLLMILSSFFIPDSFFNFYAWTAVFGAGMFVVVQIFLLIGFAYDLNESWGRKYEDEGQKMYLWLGLGAVVSLYSITLAITIASFFFFNDCWYNPSISSLGLLVSFIVLALSLWPKIQEINPKLGFLQGSVVCAYCTYTLLSAMMSEPTGCNPFYASETTSWTEYVTTTVGAVFTVVSVLYASVRTGSLSHDSDDAEKNLLASTIAAQERHDPQGHKGDGDRDRDSDDEEKTVGELPVLEDELMGDDERTATSYSYTGFHLSFMLGSMFVAMLLTNWYVISGDNDSMATDMGWVSFSVKLVACCLGFAMYFWTVFAPAIFPDRDFS